MAVTGNVQVKYGRYYAVINFYDEKGKRRQKWINTNLPIRGNKKAAEAFLNEQLAKYETVTVPYSKLTVAEYFEQWITEMEGKDYYESKLQSGSKLKSDAALSPTTVKHFQQNISKALSDAVHDNLIPANPASAVKMPKPKGRVRKFKPEFLNTQEADELLILFSGSVVELPVRLCAFYGFRRSEVLGLKWSPIDFRRRTITVETTLQQGVGGNYEDGTKTESSLRTLPCRAAFTTCSFISRNCKANGASSWEPITFAAITFAHGRTARLSRRTI